MVYRSLQQFLVAAQILIGIAIMNSSAAESVAAKISSLRWNLHGRREQGDLRFRF